MQKKQENLDDVKISILRIYVSEVGATLSKEKIHAHFLHFVITKGHFHRAPASILVAGKLSLFQILQVTKKVQQSTEKSIHHDKTKLGFKD